MEMHKCCFSLLTILFRNERVNCVHENEQFFMSLSVVCFLIYLQPSFLTEGQVLTYRVLRD